TGKQDSIVKNVIVDWPTFNPIWDKIICGNDTMHFIEPNPFFDNFKWQDNTTENFYRSWQNEYLYVTATDTTGYCKFADSAQVGKIDVFTKFSIDTIDNCHKHNLFEFSDSTKLSVDQIEHKAWVFPWMTVWDTSKALIHFPQPGKYTVYFDVYTKIATCKARYPFTVNVYPNPIGYTNFNGED